SACATTSLRHCSASIWKSTLRKVESFPMVQTARSFTAGPVTPTITYAGRLSDARKGFDLFLDALELLWSVKPPPAIAVWVIGGNEIEIQRATLSAAARPHVNEQL